MTQELIGLGSPVETVADGARGYVVARSEHLSGRSLYQVVARAPSGSRTEDWYPSHEVRLLEPGIIPPFQLVSGSPTEPPPGAPGPDVQPPGEEA